MAKDPAFLFYTGDFIAGIQDLTFEERGQYITLLCLQHQKGHLSDKLIKLSVGNAAADVMAKFRQDSAGLWFNARLDIEIEKRRLHGEKQKERALEGWKKRKAEESARQKESTGNAAALPLEDENVNENRIEDTLNKKESFEKTFIEAFDELTCENYKMTYRGKGIDFGFELQKFKTKCDNDLKTYAERDVGGLRTAFQYQLSNIKSNGKPKSGNLKDSFDRIDEIINQQNNP